MLTEIINADTGEITNEAMTMEPPLIISSPATSEMDPIVIKDFSDDRDFFRAKKYPRNPRTFIQRVFELATIDLEVAEKCFFMGKDPTTGKPEYDASVRLAELAVGEWENIKIYTDNPVIDLENKLISVRAYGVDHQSNNQISVVKTATLTAQNVDFLCKYDSLDYKKKNVGLSTKLNATTSTAYKFCVSRLIPQIFLKAIVNRIVKHIQKTVHENNSFNERMQNSILYFQKHGVSLTALLRYLNKMNSSELDVADLTNLIGVYKSIEEGQATFLQIFGEGQDARIQKIESNDIS